MKAEVDLRRWLDPLDRGRAACVFSDDVEDTLAVLQQAATSGTAAPRVVSLTWREIPPLANELGQLVAALAKATPSFFPALYGLQQSETPERWSSAQVETEAHAITRTVAGVDGGACRRILGACYRGQVPTLGKLSRAEQARQLGIAIDPYHLFVFVAVVNMPSSGEHLRSLAQGAEWLANNIRSRVILVLPDALVGRHELDHVSYGACLLLRSAVPVPVEAARLRGDSGATETRPPDEASMPSEPAIGVSPIVGRPAKNSDSEQTLCLELSKDKELSGLFAFNQPVPTVLGQTPTVDVLWAAGRLVIEIDGADHRRFQKFASDRMRDYELWLSGYAVVRFTESSVIENTPWVVERIRQAVRHLRQKEKP